MALAETSKTIRVCEDVDSTCYSSVNLTTPESLASNLKDCQYDFVNDTRNRLLTSMAASPDEQAVSML